MSAIDYKALNELIAQEMKDNDEYPIDEVAIARIVLDLLDDSMGGNNISDISCLSEALSRLIRKRYEAAVKTIRKPGIHCYIEGMQQTYWEWLNEDKGFEDDEAQRLSDLLTADLVLDGISALQKKGVAIYVTNIGKYELQKKLFVWVLKKTKKDRSEP